MIAWWTPFRPDVQVIVFHYVSPRPNSDLYIWIKLNQPIPRSVAYEIEDCVSSYLEVVDQWNPFQLIREGIMRYC